MSTFLHLSCGNSSHHHLPPRLPAWVSTVLPVVVVRLPVPTVPQAWSSRSAILYCSPANKPSMNIHCPLYEIHGFGEWHGKPFIVYIWTRVWPFPASKWMLHLASTSCNILSMPCFFFFKFYLSSLRKPFFLSAMSSMLFPSFLSRLILITPSAISLLVTPFRKLSLISQQYSAGPSKHFRNEKLNKVQRELEEPRSQRHPCS